MERGIKQNTSWNSNWDSFITSTSTGFLIYTAEVHRHGAQRARRQPAGARVLRARARGLRGGGRRRDGPLRRSVPPASELSEVEVGLMIDGGSAELISVLLIFLMSVLAPDT